MMKLTGIAIASLALMFTTVAINAADIESGSLAVTNAAAWNYFSGRLAIGHSSPSYPLDVRGGNVKFANTSGSVALFIDGHSSGNENSSFQLRRTSDLSRDRTIFERMYDTHSSVPDHFRVSHIVDNAEVALLSIQGDGDFTVEGRNVGIGTTAPDSKLHVVGSVHMATPSVKIANAGSAALFIDGYSSGNDASSFQLRRKTDLDRDRTIFERMYDSHSSVPDHFRISHLVDSAEVALVSIQGDGDVTIEGRNVGIGTTAPDSKLHVNGTAKFTGGIVLPQGATSYIYPQGDLSMGSFTNSP